MNNYKVATALFVILTLANLQFTFGFKVIYAVNFGGDRQVTSNGICYEKDPGPFDNNATETCDHGMIGYIPYSDGVVFRKMRHHYEPFSYEVPVVDDGKYLMVFKFYESIELMEAEEHRHVNVDVNGVYVIEDLDLKNDYCCEMPIEVHVPMVVQGENLHINDDSTGITKKKVNVRFSKKGKLDCIVSGLLFLKLEDGEAFPTKSWLAVQSESEDQCDDRILQCLEELNGDPK